MNDRKPFSTADKPRVPITPPAPAKRRPASWTARKRLLQVVEDWRAAERVIANQKVRLADQARQISRLEAELEMATANARWWAKENRTLVLQLAAVRAKE